MNLTTLNKDQKSLHATISKEDTHEPPVLPIKIDLNASASITVEDSGTPQPSIAPPPVTSVQPSLLKRGAAAPTRINLPLIGDKIMREAPSTFSTNALYNHVFSHEGSRPQQQLPNLDVSQPIVYADLSWLTTPALAAAEPGAQAPPTL